MAVVECQDANDYTPLSEAGSGGNVDAITFLIQRGQRKLDVFISVYCVYTVFYNVKMRRLTIPERFKVKIKET